MTNPPCRIIGAKLADAEPRAKNGGVIASGDPQPLLKNLWHSSMLCHFLLLARPSRRSAEHPAAKDA